ncbi:MAG: hypothetical protein Q9170_007489, partial [Blastenia crenularia]
MSVSYFLRVEIPSRAGRFVHVALPQNFPQPEPGDAALQQRATDKSRSEEQEGEEIDLTTGYLADPEAEIWHGKFRHLLLPLHLSPTLFAFCNALDSPNVAELTDLAQAPHSDGCC